MINIESLAIDMATLFAEEAGDKSILVAGQALAVWGVYYLGEHIPMDQLSPLASRDIDFYHTRKVGVERYATLMKDYLNQNGLELEAYYPGPEEATINVGKWVIREAEKNEPESDPIEIDFINFISGITTQEIKNENNVDTFIVGANKFKILCPTLCLKARINNLLDLYPRLLKPEDRLQNEEERVKLGIQIVCYHIRELIYQKDDTRRAHDRANQIIEIAKSRNGRLLFRSKGISVLDAIPREGLNAKFYSHHLVDADKKMRRQ